MITQIASENLVVISDLHIGNPFSNTRRRTIEFIEWASRNGLDICINGDGFEVAQVSREKIASDVPDILLALKQAVSRGTRIYYVVGNHDIFFEHFLHDWGGVQMVPFLNVLSSQKRIRVEHGHLYDPFFVKWPKVYEFCTWFGGVFLHLAPSVYRLWIAFEKIRYSFGRKNISGEHPSFRVAAEALESRGFDGIIFGHTHHAGKLQLSMGGKYLNPGSWMLEAHYIQITKGEMELKRFEGKHAA